MKLYIAGKVSEESVFGTHHYRDDFCAELVRLSGLELENLDPLKSEVGLADYRDIFAKDCRLINQAYVCVVYLSDDISVGGSQEILIARYLRRPVISFAPIGGKFNGSRKEMLGGVFENYKDPFVFSTCNVVCGSIEEVASALGSIANMKSDSLNFIDNVLSTE